MADRRVRYILEVDYDGESTILKAADDLREVDDAAREAGEGLERAEGGFSKAQAAVVTLSSGLSLVQQGFDAVSNVVSTAWAALEEGAALQDLGEDFDALAQQAGTTADVLVGEMRDAAGGMMTNAEMMGAASDLMLMNLGLTNDEIVELVGLAGELEWSMDAVANALNTKSSRALKELGLGIDDVKGRVAELQAQGHSLDEAFTLAILDAGRARIELVGGASETAAGKMVVATNAVEDYTAGLKESIVVGLEAAGVFDVMAREAEEMSLASDMRELIDQYEELSGLRWTTPGGLANMNADELEAEARRIALALDLLRVSSGDFERDFVESSDDIISAALASADAVMIGAQARQEYAESQEWTARAAEWMADTQMRAAQADYTRAQAVAELTAQEEAAAAAREAMAEAITTGGDYFTEFSQSDKVWEFADALYAAADAAGAGIEPLANLADQYDLIDPAKIREAVDASQQQVIIDNLAAAAASGQISWDNYAAAVEHGIEVLHGAYAIDLGTRALPEMEDRGFREGFQEQLSSEIEPIPIELDVETEAFNAAIAEAVGLATGVIEDWVSQPAEVKATMNIEEVVAKSEDVKGMLNDIPKELDISVRLTVSGGELIDELIALGAIGP